ncbi:uncharacterized protein DUF3558 [Saccharopolyspora erythraea NRRL 2338]|uniref:Uncharacterized protein n=2 Tax=Saccharopolyspora erythraea TaxID=1836 RepID=A4F7Z5_SACEN|nr:DUF3558 domain-containing protein [Saccharopolyspora erythraea]EQD85798.1 hypothetical protein N599_13020 [Saccharopolyspora erythraea D]PFG93966.1 uncharacterized protein DUF3558 [Saccharopolyspora erythraea NRRL 2338]QRK90781.1 DUF3558 domain-containing protein [Saccharopolyspora erythraea]CAM00169.1 hypothetical protein SACE_0829 [Saccharopolyspora erythraea NRRL 2338]
MIKKSALVLAPLLTSVLITGCGAPAAVSPPPAPPPDLHGAPSVDKPLETGSLHQDPCRVLSPEQLVALGIAGAPQADSDVSGPSCEWDDIGGPPHYTVDSLRVTFVVGGDGLKLSYARRDAYSYFRELPRVEGYPAIAAGSTPGGTPEEEGTCELAVGVTDDLVVLTQVHLGNGSPSTGEPCGRAGQVATEVMKTIKAASGVH